MPGMLGWFNMSAETSLEDAEWLLARAAGYDAGFCLCTGPQIVQQNGDGEAILASMKEWEKARMSSAFSDDQKTRMQKIENEFHLTPSDSTSWNLVQVYSKKGRLPVSGSADLDLLNPYDNQPVQFIIQIPAGTKVDNLAFRIDDGALFDFKESLEGSLLRPLRRQRGDLILQ